MNNFERNNIYIAKAASIYNILVDVDKRTLELYKDGKLYKVYSVAVGKSSTPTPKGIFTIKSKSLNPGGQYGTRWMGLSKPYYGIHGTNEPESIGKASSKGCVRMYNEDVEELYLLVSIGTEVKIV